MKEPFCIHFPGNHTAQVAIAESSSNLREILPSLGFDLRPRPVLVIIGGAGHLSPEDHDRVTQLFTDVLVPIADRYQACVVDGGTNSGVMHLMGQARARAGGTFPLIGVSPIDLVEFPEHPSPEPEAAALEPHHSHFILIPGSRWGDESPWLAQVASELAGQAPSVAVLLNGGEITWKDAKENAGQGRPIIVVEGSGRVADVIAARLRGHSGDARVDPLIATGLVQAIDLSQGVRQLSEKLQEMFQSVSSPARK